MARGERGARDDGLLLPYSPAILPFTILPNFFTIYHFTPRYILLTILIRMLIYA